MILNWKMNKIVNRLGKVYFLLFIVFWCWGCWWWLIWDVFWILLWRCLLVWSSLCFGLWVGLIFDFLEVLGFWIGFLGLFYYCLLVWCLLWFGCYLCCDGWLFCLFFGCVLLEIFFVCVWGEMNWFVEIYV